MKTIEYRVVYSGMDRISERWPLEEIIRVEARNINSGYAKALKRALEPLGNGKRREIIELRFWQVL